MSEPKMVRVQLRNSGLFVNTDEEGASALQQEQEKGGKSLDETMNALEDKNTELAAVQATCEELKGELSVYKEKLDALLSTEAIEQAAAEQVAEAGEAGEIVENAFPEGEEKEKVCNSLKGKYGNSLRSAALAAIGVKVENMSPEAIKVAFKAQVQIANAMKGKAKPTTVAGANLFQNDKGAPAVPAARTPMQRLGVGK